MADIRLIFVGDSHFFREGSVLTSQSGVLTVSALVPSLSEARSVLKADAVTPDLLLYDCPDDMGPDLGALGEFATDFPSIGVVVLTDRIDTTDRAVAAGARGVFPKVLSAEALVLALQLIARGEDILPSPAPEFNVEISEATRRFDATDARALLSTDESKVLKYLEDGASSEAIARELGIDESIVIEHLKSVLRKLNSHGRAQADTSATRHRTGNCNR